MMLTGATASPSSDLDPKSARDLDTKLACDLDSRSGSLKRKHVGSTPSLSNVDRGPSAETSNGSRRPTGLVSEEDTSSSSSISASSSDAAICDVFPLPPGDEAGPHDTGTSSRRRNSFAELQSELNRTLHPWDDVRSEPAVAAAENELNQNVLPDPAGRSSTCPNAPLTGEEAVVVQSLGSVSSMDFEDPDDVAAGVHSPPSHGGVSVANVLVVSHGGFISQLLGHFADDFDCRRPGGDAKISVMVTPNAGLSRFLVTVSPRCSDTNDPTCSSGRSVSIQCLTLHDKDHLANNVDAEPLPTSEPL